LPRSVCCGLTTPSDLSFPFKLNASNQAPDLHHGLQTVLLYFFRVNPICLFQPPPIPTPSSDSVYFFRLQINITDDAPFIDPPRPSFSCVSLLSVALGYGFSLLVDSSINVHRERGVPLRPCGDIHLSMHIHNSISLVILYIYIYIPLSLYIYIYMYKKRGRLTNYVLFLDYTASDRAPHLPDGRRARLHGHAL